ncbi:MAG TPA: hypothetical protein IAB04_01895, partial [Candidatus Avimonoglobus intestinipullorum]|nr:hypothetical protein [Candidatus Avimonoglobus intestinipullorum]
EAVVTTVIKKKADKTAKQEKTEVKNPFLKKMGWLNNMLWGGSALLAFEHVWHGEITPWFPFLTNAANPADAAAMLGEMATSGVGMALLVTAVWAVMVGVTNAMEKQPEAVKAAANGGIRS